MYLGHPKKREQYCTMLLGGVLTTLTTPFLSGAEVCWIITVLLRTGIYLVIKLQTGLIKVSMSTILQTRWGILDSAIH